MDHATDPENLKHPGNFSVLDAKLAAGFGKVLHGELGRSINVLEGKAVLRQEMLGGRQIAWHVYQHFKTTECEGAVLEFEDFLRVGMRGDNLRAYITDWELVLCSLKELPAKDIQESFVPTSIKQGRIFKSNAGAIRPRYFTKGRK